MRKFKLIREYPGSPKLGREIVQSKSNEDLYYTERFNNFPIENPEKYPEFWQEVVEKDYEILSVLFDNNVYVLNNSVSKIYCGFGVGNCICLNHYENEYKIQSVKRLSDGEIFTIGDLVGTPGSIYPLKEFKIIDSENTVAAHYYKDKIGGSGHYNHRLKNLKKAKQPLFTTEDGVDIFEGDKFYTLLRDLSNITITECKASIHSKFEKYIDFSTKEKAEEYILMNKPCLSLNDIFKDVEKMRKGLKTFENSELAKRFKKLVQQKLNK